MKIHTYPAAEDANTGAGSVAMCQPAAEARLQPLLAAAP